MSGMAYESRLDGKEEEHVTNEPTNKVRTSQTEEPKPALSKARWEAECYLMTKVFPDFTPYVEGRFVGFQGELPGPRSGRNYSVVLRAPMTEYPYREPAVFIDPRPEPRHYEANGQLSLLPRWNPARSTFAQMLLFAIKYLHEFDRPEEGGEPQ